MDTTYILIGLAVLVAVGVAWFVFARKPEAPPALEERPSKKTPERKLAQPPHDDDEPAEKPAPKREKPVSKPPPEKADKKAGEKQEKRASEKPPEVEAAEEPESSLAPAPREKVSVAPPKVASIAPAERTSTPAPPVSQASRASGEKAPPRKRDVEGLRKGLAKSREGEGFFGRLRALFTGKKEIDPQIVEHMEEVLLTSDVGVKTTALLLAEIKERLSKKELDDSDKVWEALKAEAASILRLGPEDGRGGGIEYPAKPTVVMVVGVNGVGKTTTIGKLATKLKGDGKKVVLAAGDTFRAAAVEQLKVWGKRANVEVVAGKDGANPGAVIFDAIQRAKETGADVVLADTAGRLHTKTNLMEELTKVARTMGKALEGAPHETLLVLDATNGQNAIQQAALFKEALPITGIVLTKLDGTAKGGVILGICAEHKVPVRYVGIGERAEDLRDFEADEFVEAMLGHSEG